MRRMDETGSKFGRVDEVTLKPGAKIIDYDELHKGKLEEESKLMDKVFDAADIFGKGSPEHRAAKDLYYDIADMNYDEYVKHKGYDAIRHDATGYTVVVNQNALVIKK